MRTNQKSVSYLEGLDYHFARLMERLSGEDNHELFLAAALLSRARSEGHICLDLSSVAAKPISNQTIGMEYPLSPELSQWCKALEKSAVVGRPGDYKPLILDDRCRLYLFRYWDYERSLHDDIAARASSEIRQIDLPSLKNGLTRLFGPAEADRTNWQKVAAFVSTTKRFSVISGGPGTGKTSVIAAVLCLILILNRDKSLKTALAAPTGKAAARLSQAIQANKEMLPVSDEIKKKIVAEASTIHRLLGSISGSIYFRHDALNPLPYDIVVIDEVSMVDMALLAKLVRAVPSRARLILLGDRDQLASVEAGAVLGDICDTGRNHGFSDSFAARVRHVTGEFLAPSPDRSKGPAIRDCMVQLQESYRFDSQSGIGAVSRAVNEGQDQTALNLLKTEIHEDIGWRSLPKPEGLANELRNVVLAGYGPYLTAKGPKEALQRFERFRLLCALRVGPYGSSALNRAVEQILRGEGLLDPADAWYRGRPVIITHNDYNLGLFNGDIGTVQPDPESGGDLRVFFPSQEGLLKRFHPIRLPAHETVFAMTVHKSQGSEFDEAVFILSNEQAPVIKRELIYTGLTRARRRIEVWGDEEVFSAGVRERTVRTSGLRDALWEEAFS